MGRAPRDVRRLLFCAVIWSAAAASITAPCLSTDEAPQIGKVRPWQGAAAACSFRFRPGETDRYKVIVHNDVSMQGVSDGEKISVRVRTDISEVLSVRCRECTPDGAVLALGVSDMRTHGIVTAGGETVDVEIKGKDVVARHNGETVIDTARGVGLDDLGALKQQLPQWEGRTAEVVVDARGLCVREPTGDAGLASYIMFFEPGQLFPLVLAKPSVPADGKWEQKGSFVFSSQEGTVSLDEPVTTHYAVAGIASVNGSDCLKTSVSQHETGVAIHGTASGDPPRRMEGRGAQLQTTGTSYFDLGLGKLRYCEGTMKCDMGALTIAAEGDAESDKVKCSGGAVLQYRMTLLPPEP